MTIDDLKSQLGQFNIRPSKKLGQNFLLSEEVLDKISEVSEINPGETILEIGPGLGALTRKLGEKADLVLAVEKDHNIVTALHRLFRNKKNIKIIQGDALFINPSDLFPEFGERSSETETNSDIRSTNYKLVANIPYYITGKLLRNFLETDQKPSRMVLMLQKEVAERIIAKPGKHSVLSVSTQFYSDPSIVIEVPRDNFFPAPDVDSAVVKLDIFSEELLKQKWGDVEETKFFKLIKTGFTGKRKMLKNNLKSLTGISVESLLTTLKINPKARAQDLSLEEWVEVYNEIFKS